MKNILSVLLIFLALQVYGQEYQQEYLQGKQFLNSGKYALAMESFKPLVRPDSENELSNYAMYYYAVAAYKDGYPALAKDMLLQVRELFPQWDQMDEVRLWLARIYFEEKSFNQAINVLNQIRTRELQNEKEEMLNFHVNQLDDVFYIQELFNVNEENKIIAKRLAEIVAVQPLQQRNDSLLLAIIDKFNFNPDEFDAGIITETVFKDAYRVAVLLPFVHQTLEVDTRKKKNQFVLDLYNGIRLAAEDLANRGVNIELYAYDTQREYNATLELLEQDEMKTMDLIIGPLYPEPLKLVQDFAYRNKINMINPISHSPSVIANNPFSFLFKPGFATIGEAIAEFAVEEVKNPYGIILYGQSEADSILAHSYKETFEQDSFKIVLMEKIAPDNVRRILDILTSSGLELKDAVPDEENEVEFTIPKDSVGSIFVASDEGMIITRVLSGIETRTDSILILGSERWLEIKAIDYNALQRLKVSMAAPMYYDYTDDAFVAFRGDYLARHKEIPSEFAILGYDVLMFTGTALDKFGKYFQLGLKSEPTIDGFLLTGYNYKNTNDNQVVPIVRVIDNEPQPVVIKNYATDQQK